MVTVEFDLNDGKNILCSIYTLTNNYDALALKLSKIVQKCLSIPITIRALLKLWEQERLKGYHHHRSMENGNFNLPLGPNDPGGGGGVSRGGNNNGGGNNGSTTDFRDIKIKTERGSSGGTGGLSGVNNGSNCNSGNTNFNNMNGSGNGIGGGRQFYSGGMSSTENAFGTVRNNLSIFEQASVSAADNNGARLPLNQFGHDFQDQFRSNISGGIVTGFSTTGEDFYKSPKSVFCNNNSLSETSGDSNSLGAATQSTTTSDSGVTATKTKNFQKMFEKDAVDNNSNSNSSCSNTSTITTVLSSDKNKSNDKLKNFKDLEKIDDKVDPLSTPLNITPMSASELTSVLTGMGLEKRPGIEIIPISSSSNQNFQTSITITPINVSSSSSSSSKSSKKHSSGSSSASVKKSEDKLKSEKKRKRKKDDAGSSLGGQMGPPPEKQASKLSDSLHRTSSVSGLTTKKDPLSVSPNRNKHSGITVSNNSTSASMTMKPSSKHSPASYSSVSPKNQHSMTSGVSPKHSLSGSSSSGKPSMLALKTATNSLTSPKSEKTSLKSQSSSSKDKLDRERSGDKAVKNLCGTPSTSPKIKSSTVKLKQIDLSAAFLHHLESTSSNDDSVFSQHTSGSSEVSAISPSGGQTSAAGGGNQSKVRKGSLSAVIDKLKSAQNSGDEISGGGGNGGVDDSVSNNFKLSGTSAGSSEYMIKPSLDGMKITINKTRTKDISALSTQKISSPPVNTSSSSFKFSSSSSFNSGGASSNSLKRQSNAKSNFSQSGTPSSKKSIITSLLKSTNNSSSSPLPNNSNVGNSSSNFSTTKSNFQRTNSSGNLSSGKSGGSSLGSSGGSSSDLYRKDKSSKIGKSGGLSSSGGGTDSGGGSGKQINSRSDPIDVMKILRMTSPNNSMDGFMKSLDTKFQIPKLSARTNDDSKKDSSGNKQITSSATAQSTIISTTSTSSATTTFSTTTTATTVSQSSISASVSSGNISSNPDTLKDSPSTIKIQMQQQQQQQGSLISTSQQQPQQQLANIHHNSSATSTGSKISPSYFPSPSTSPKCRSSGSDSNPSFVTQLSKSSSSDAILNTFRQKDYNMIKPHSISTPSTPIHVQSPFASPIGAINSSSSTTAINKPSLGSGTGSTISTSGIGGMADALTMRPPSAPCTMDITTVEASGKFASSAGNVSTTIVTAATTTTSNTIATAKKIINATSQSSTTVTTIAVTTPSSSSSSSTLNNKMPIPPPPSSSVSIHIVKSPVPSPLMLLPSPHSNSSCITDEEMIDESLIGIKGK